jgi:hypothetical protein
MRRAQSSPLSLYPPGMSPPPPLGAWIFCAIGGSLGAERGNGELRARRYCLPRIVTPAPQNPWDLTANGGSLTAGELTAESGKRKDPASGGLLVAI